MASKCIPIYPYPILLVETSDYRKFLTISDVHIGCEDRIRRAGVLINPQENINSLVETLMTVHKDTGVSNLIILGDVKSSTNVISRSEWHTVPDFFRSLLNNFEVYIIPGNHDGNLSQLLPTDINLMLARGMQVDDILFIHGHSVPKITPNVKKIISGHLHPTLRKEGSIIHGKRVWIRILLSNGEYIPIASHISDAGRIEVIILPHFNDLLDFFYNSHKRKNVSNKKSKLPFLNSMLHKHKWKIDNAFIYTLDGSLVGTIADLDPILY
ncbi:metallophosphoesterase [Candidatus Nitrosocosmicus franklandus]|uniref:Calcineurin-like phosphoesterase superfamily domain protein n=1 Tax=Candidatus Nitrosocosmicus franklandianus TaxID=1798806 RepID=A0A484I4Q0_9ARCH|nr:metallophosphoesterase [Candidatus Nitrosocosmicus franklandus]VFJ12726.1 Calcineurin-like phosphoesterase superfamily domain protein [Candidatus Nitrosocosmicus franklandus]